MSNFMDGQELDRKIIKRIHDSDIKKQYMLYVNCEILSKFVEILNQVSENAQAPIIKTQLDNPLKEKPLLIYAVAPIFSQKTRKQAQAMAAAIEMLYTLAVIYDDMVDRDRHRFGKLAAWVKFGKRATRNSLHYGLKATYFVLERYFNGKIAREGMRRYEEFIELDKKHSALTFKSPLKEFFKVYIARADFYTAFPARVLFRGSTQRAKRVRAIKGFVNFQLASQLLNDLKDLSPRYAWARKSFSDIRNNFITVPTRMLWDCLADSEKKTFKSLFGKKRLHVRRANSFSII